MWELVRPISSLRSGLAAAKFSGVDEIYENGPPPPAARPSMAGRAGCVMTAVGWAFQRFVRPVLARFRPLGQHTPGLEREPRTLSPRDLGSGDYRSRNLSVSGEVYPNAKRQRVSYPLDSST